MAPDDEDTHDNVNSERETVKGYRTPSWFRAKRNVELKQAKAKISKRHNGKRKKTN